MGDHVMQFPRDPGAFLQHGPLRPLGLDALGLGVQARWERSREPTLSTATATAVKTKVAPAGPFRFGTSAASHSHHGMRLRAHIHHRRRPLQDGYRPGRMPQQREYLPRAPRPAGHARRRVPAGRATGREPADPPGQQGIPGRQRHGRHHRAASSSCPMRRDTDEVDGAERERRHAQRGIRGLALLR